MDSLRAVNLALRFALELCALAAAAYWGATVAAGTVARAGVVRRRRVACVS